MPASGRSMLLALDTSASMRTAVLGPELGIEVLRRTARAFIASRAGDRIGLIVFGSKAYVQAPLSFDLQADHLCRGDHHHEVRSEPPRAIGSVRSPCWKVRLLHHDGHTHAVNAKAQRPLTFMNF